MARPPITAKGALLFRQQLNAALDYVDDLGGGVWGEISGTLTDQTDLVTELSGKQPLATVLTNTTAAFTTAQESKLAGIASGAQVNVATDLTYTAATRLLASSTGADATLPLVSSGDAGLAPASGGGTTNFLRADGTWAAPSGGGGVSDGDKGDITVSASGATWTIDNAAVTLPKMADMATASLIYRKTAGAGAPEVNTLATLKTDLGLTGTNSGDQTTIVGITGTKAQFDTAVTDGNFLYVGDVTSNATHTGDVTGATALTIANDAVTYAKMQNVSAASRLLGRGDSGSGDPQEITLGANLTMTGTTLAATGGGATNLTYTAATRVIASDTGTDATLPLVTSGDAGLAPASGGGTSNFLRADGTWAAPSGGGGSTIYYGHLQSNYTLTSTTAVQKLFNWSTNGALTLPTGVYRFRSMIYLTTMSATSGNGSFRLKGGGTATVARVLYNVLGIDNTSPLNTAAKVGTVSVTENSAASMVTAGTGTGLTAIIEGFFDVTVTGTIIPSIALVTAAAAVVQAGSFFECERVGDTATAASTGWT